MAEKRFKEIISTQKIIDNITKKEYHGLVDDKLFELINNIAEENMRLKSENAHYEFLLMSLEDAARKFCEVPRVKNDKER